MKIRRVRVLMAKGWCKVVCFVSFSLFSVVCNHASAQNVIDMSSYKDKDSLPTVDEVLQGKVAGFDILFESGDLAYGPPVSSLMRKLDKIIPLVALDFREKKDIDEAKLASFDFENFYNDRDSLASLLGVKKSSLKAVRYLQNPKSVTIWGRQGYWGVIEIMTKEQYRKSRKEGKLEDDWELLK